MATIWVGTYPADGLGAPVGQGEGLWRASLDGGALAGAVQVTTQPAPSFVARHPALPFLYAIEEATPTVLSVIAIDEANGSTEVARVALEGEGGCHVLVAPDASALYVSNYGTGELVAVRLAADGLPDAGQPQTWPHQGSGPHADRQGSSHAHSACVSPDGLHVLVADLGTDEIRRYRIGTSGMLGDPGIAACLPPGSGPRHMAVRGGLIYVVCELDHQLRTLRWDSASASADLIAQQPITLAPHRTGSAVYDAHVAVVERDKGDVLLVSVRGADVISVFDIAPEGELTYRAAFDAGYWPRHFTIVGDALVVAAEKGHEVRAFRLSDVLALAPEQENGAVATLPFSTIGVSSPACIVAL